MVYAHVLTILVWAPAAYAATAQVPFPSCPATMSGVPRFGMPDMPSQWDIALVLPVRAVFHGVRPRHAGRPNARPGRFYGSPGLVSMETGRRLSGAEEILRGRIVEHVKSIGLGGGVSTPMRARAAQARLRDAQARESPGMLAGGADEARLFCPDGADVDPRRIRPELRPVEPGTAGERLFRWWSRAWWSVPYQKACGRQMRFLVWGRRKRFPDGPDVP